MQSNTRVYFAGPLFTQAEWQWNARIAAQLELRSIEVLLPQRRAEPMLTGAEEFNPLILFQENLRQLESADAVVAILDGADADSGTSWECGYAYRLGIPVVGVRTEIRAGGDDPQCSVNLMLSMGCTAFVHIPLNLRNDIDRVVSDVIKAINTIKHECA